ncbi:MAG TPA: lipopolysaccharide biosynthesis protein [Jatrophihabitans sp.]|nr:lipopolysaccharide biosynthesis protein [Jatrophihabitans sp.]
MSESSAAESPPTERSLGQRVRRGALWSAASTLILRLANISIMAIVARTLAPRDFGVFAVALTVHAIVSSIAELGVASCLVRADVDADELAPTVAAVSLISSTVLAAAMFAFAVPLSAALGSADAAGPMRVMALAVVLVGIFAVPGAELAREFRQDKQFAANLLGFAASNALLLALALHGGGALSFAWSRVVGQLLIGSTMTLMVRHHYLPRIARRHLRTILSFGLPLAGANLLNYVLLNTDYVFIGKLLGPIELGVYMLAFNISSWSSSLMSTILNSIAMPAFSRVKDDRRLLQDALVRAVVALCFFALPICVLSATLAHPLVRTVYGARWDRSASVLAILASYGAISVLCLLLANALSGLGRTNLLLITQIPWLGCLIPAMAIGIHLHGIVGAAWAHILVVCLVALPVYLRMLTRSAPIRLAPVGRAVSPLLLAALLAGLTAYLISHAVSGAPLQLLAGGLAGGLVYLLLALPLAPHVVGRFARLPGRLATPVDFYARKLRVLGLGIPEPVHEAELTQAAENHLSFVETEGRL